MDHLSVFFLSGGFFMVVHMLFWVTLWLYTFCSVLLRFMEELPLVHAVISLSVAFFILSYNCFPFIFGGRHVEYNNFLFKKKHIIIPLVLF